WTSTRKTPGCCAACCNKQPAPQAPPLAPIIAPGFVRRLNRPDRRGFLLPVHSENPEVVGGRGTTFRCMLCSVLSGGYMNIRFTPVAAAIGLAAGMMMSTGAMAADTVKIAIAGPFTGALTQYGTMVKEGVDTAIEQISAGCGVLGKKHEAVTIDDGCEPKQG